MYKYLINKTTKHQLKIFLWLILCFLSHRLCTFVYLSDDEIFSWINFLNHLWVASLSDIWISYLFSFFLWPIFYSIYYIEKRFGFHMLSKFINFMIVTLIASALMFHHSYVEFFGHSFHPIHLEYLYDKEFIKANGIGNTSLLSLFTFLSVCLAYILINKMFRSYTLHGIKPNAYFIALLFIFKGSHSLNIHYRGALNIPDQLQMNVAEKFYLETQTTYESKLLPLVDVLSLSKNGDNLSSVDDILYTLAGDIPDDSFSHHLKKYFDQAAEKGKNPGIILIIMESLRKFELEKIHWEIIV